MNRIKKHRGLKRYYRNLETKTDNWSGLNFTDAKHAWFNLWHTHFDWNGYGNNSFKKRKPHLDKLFRHFELLEKKVQLLNSDFQIWVTLLDNTSHSDALYLHTPNPDRDNFPYKLDGLSPKNTLTNELLKSYINNLEGYEKLYGNASEAFCVLHKKNIGYSNYL